MSKKLAGAVAAMIAVVGIVALTAFRIVDPQIAALGIVTVAGLGGYQVQQQAKLDATKPEG
jgi:hypothetical protein